MTKRSGSRLFGDTTIRDMAKGGRFRVLANWIDGEHQAPSNEAYLDVLGPATGDLVAMVPQSSRSDVAAAVTAAKRALPAWAATPVAERAAILAAAADRIEARAGELAELESIDTGKPITLARTVDIPRAIANFRFFAGAILHDQTPAHVGDGLLNYTLRQPVGVAALVTPWNLPIYLLSWKTAPALACGNTVVAKPSELTPMTASALAAILAEAGLPNGVFNVVHGLGIEAGAALVSHPDVSLVSFTGGTASGAKVAAAAAPQFKKLSLELGGKNPTVVFADADLDAAVEGAVRAAFLNQGQVCLCGSRLLIERGIYERFVHAFVERVRRMKVGDPSEEATELGALVSDDHRKKVEGYIELAKEEGGELLCGGYRPPLPKRLDKGFYLFPAVISNLSPTCRTATEEIFGPVVTVHAFDTDEEALEIANGVRYGLSASVWTGNLSRAHRFSAALEVGMVWVNGWLLRDLRVPFGGVKDSGVGREGGSWSLDFFSQQKNVCVKL